MASARWWVRSWRPGSAQDPDQGWDRAEASPEGSTWWESASAPSGSDPSALLAHLEAGQVRSRDRVRQLAEVFTHQREIDAMLALIPVAFQRLDVTFLEPACGSGNFLVEVLRRKLLLVAKGGCVSQEHYEHRLLRAIASVYGIDISPENVTEARSRMAHVVLNHYQFDANTTKPTAAFLNALMLILDANVIVGDAINGTAEIELCEWRPAAGGRFQRRWSHALVPEHDRDLFQNERVQDPQPVHYADLGAAGRTASAARKRKAAL